MSDGFKGFANPGKDREFTLNINGKEVQKIIREYKKLKKYQKSSMYELEKLSGQQTQLDKLVDKFGIDSEAIE
tara:strand:+ start:291 stop:509 length:219 start_codon:yes stop_codon:yes gene_type:complete